MNVAIDRIDVVLAGVSECDARRVSEQLAAALEPLVAAGAHIRSAPVDSPLAPGLHGRALVDAVAARVADAIGQAVREAARRTNAESDDGLAEPQDAGATTWP